MPNNTNERKGKQAGELSAEERFRNFFSTSVIDLPEEMTRRDEPAPVEEKPKAGLLGKLFSHDKEETPAPAQPVLEIPTGEILLGADAKPVQPEQEDMALELRTADPVPAMPMQPASPEPAKAVPAEPVPAPKAAAAVQPEPEKPAPQPVPQPVAAPQKQPKAKNAPETLLPQEELEQREMQQLKDMLNGMSGKAKPAPQPAKPVQVAPQPKVQPAPAQPAAEPEKAPAKAAQNAAEELPLVVFASAPADPETLPKKPEKKSIFQMFGTAEDEKPAARKPEKEDTMSLPLLPLEQDGTPAAETAASVSAPAAAATPAQPETAPEAQAAAVQPRQGRDARPGTACAGDPHRRDPAGGRCKAGTAGAGGHGAGTAYRRPCSGNADAARQPRACQGSSGRAGACTQGGCCRAAGAGKARAPAGAAACCSPPKAA